MKSEVALQKQRVIQQQRSGCQLICSSQHHVSYFRTVMCNRQNVMSFFPPDVGWCLQMLPQFGSNGYSQLQFHPEEWRSFHSVNWKRDTHKSSPVS